MRLRITDVRAVPGDSAFLLDDGKTAILYDTGFAFTGCALADNVKKILGNRQLDYIFLTHSHYDHALGSPCVREAYPGVKVVAGEYAAEIFARPSARRMMRELDRKHAAYRGVDHYNDRIDELVVDIPVKEGESIQAGNLNFTVVELPGHTKCSVGFYLASEKLLLSTETLGVYVGDDTVVPSYLVGYQMTLDSIAKVKGMDIERILVPHYGLLEGEEAAFYLSECEKSAEATARGIVSILEAGGTHDDAVRWFRNTYYSGNVPSVYPVDAMLVNTNIMVNLIEKELI